MFNDEGYNGLHLTCIIHELIFKLPVNISLPKQIVV